MVKMVLNLGNGWTRNKQTKQMNDLKWEFPFLLIIFLFVNLFYCACLFDRCGSIEWFHCWFLWGNWRWSQTKSITLRSNQIWHGLSICLQHERGTVVLLYYLVISSSFFFYHYGTPKWWLQTFLRKMLEIE